MPFILRRTLPQYFEEKSDFISRLSMVPLNIGNKVVLFPAVNEVKKKYNRIKCNEFLTYLFVNWSYLFAGDLYCQQLIANISN